jgi:hypothetical protein
MMLVLLASVAGLVAPTESSDACTAKIRSGFTYHNEMRDGGHPILIVTTDKEKTPIDGCLQIGKCAWSFAPTDEFANSLNNQMNTCSFRQVSSEEGKPNYRALSHCDEVQGAAVSAPYRAIARLSAQIPIDCDSVSQYVSTDKWTIFQAKVSGAERQGCISIGISPTSTNTAVLLSPTCLPATRLKTFAFPASTSLLIRSPESAIGWQLSPNGKQWTVSALPNSNSAYQYEKTWTQSVASAANSAPTLVRPQHDMPDLVPLSSDDVQLGWLVRWATAGTYEVPNMPGTTNEWKAAAPLRDWMAEALMLNPQAAAGTFYRVECNTGSSRTRDLLCPVH